MHVLAAPAVAAVALLSATLVVPAAASAEGLSRDLAERLIATSQAMHATRLNLAAETLRRCAAQVLERRAELPACLEAQVQTAAADRAVEHAAGTAWGGAAAAAYQAALGAVDAATLAVMRADDADRRAALAHRE